MNTLILIIYILIMIFLIYYFLTKNDKKRKKQLQQDSTRHKKQNVLLEKQVIHLGGHPYLNSNDIIYLQIRKNNSIYCYKKNTDSGKEISINQITKYEIKNDEQIQKDITLGRYLVFGLASIALPKKKKIMNEYLLLSYIQNKVNVDCLFKNTDNQNLGDIISTLNRLKIKKNRGEECVI